eukprot:CAMPEP_0197894814 /NCGR_PEP_ID=MMETSP1439-20131203/36028_1 /TAXON_ID=66791 /ORGANISM="Gonyaulax spinifera, Strain CCMP409" /LENGTH=285 /DNA_ID=CAMNT_0043515197 /DNA_START=171 /DNA_END=1026 /DNA_ORIENTATION=+
MTYLEYEETPEFHKYLEDQLRKELEAQGINATIDTKDMFWKLDPARDFLVSSCVNNPTPEAWSGFVARWVLWHLTTFFIVECKVEILPRPLTWLPIMWGLTLLIVIWSGIHQFENFRYSKHYGEQRQMTHIGCAFVAFITCWIETVCIWCPSRLLHAAFGALVVSFALVGMSFPELYVGEVLEWSILASTWSSYGTAIHACQMKSAKARGGPGLDVAIAAAARSMWSRVEVTAAHQVEQSIAALRPKNGEDERQDPACPDLTDHAPIMNSWVVVPLEVEALTSKK